MKHTPGPWKATIDTDFRLMVYKNSYGEEEKIAHVLGRGKEAEANTRLIAASPELLEAADSLLEKLGRLYPIDQVPSKAVLDLFEVVQKAKGEGTGENEKAQ